MDKALTGSAFSSAYKESLFLEWYQLGKPAITDYWLKMSLDNRGRRPSKDTVIRWATKWKERSKILDKEVEMGIVEQAVAEKVEMLRRHANIGKEIQSLSLDYLRDVAENQELTPNAAVRLLQIGVDMERDSVGVPEALEKMSKLDDESLLKEISSIVNSSGVTIEAIDNELKDS